MPSDWAAGVKSPQSGSFVRIITVFVRIIVHMHGEVSKLSLRVSPLLRPGGSSGQHGQG